MNEALIKLIDKEARGIRNKILKKQKPAMKFLLLNLSNVKFDPKAGFFQIGRKTKERTLAVATVKTFAQSLKMIALSKNLIETDDIATKREAYYVAKGWDEEVRFAEQTESDAVLDDVEAFFSVNREQLGFVPEEKGGEVAGNLVVYDADRDSGDELAIDCTKFGSGAYSIPISVEHLRFESDAKFVLAIETAGMFQRLVKHNYWRRANQSDPALHPPDVGGFGHSGLRLRRLRSLRHLQYLPHAQGRLGQRRAYQRGILRAEGAFFRGNAGRYRRLRPANAQDVRGRYQADRRRD